MYHPETLEPIVAFVRALGVGVVYGEGARGGFLPGLNIHEGEIHVDPDTLVGPGDILHEAGHIIVMPRRYWPRLGRDLQQDIDAILAEEPENPELTRAARRGEFMSQAWSYAVARHLGLPMECIFFPGSYKYHQYEGAHPMLVWLEMGTHYGPMALAEAGMTGPSGLFAVPGTNDLPPFPHMSRWTLD